MKNNLQSLLVAVGAAALVSACATDGKPIASADVIEPCSKPGYTQTKVRYGDSRIIVKPLSKVRPGTAFRFKLQPQRSASDETDYRTVLVTIKSKGSVWLPETSGTFEDARDGLLTSCVPPDLQEKVYYYLVEVDDVGVLDPRADVSN